MTDDAYFMTLIAYIHRNPQKHGFVDDFRAWTYSSYHAHLSAQSTRLKRDDVLAWFYGPEGFCAFHQQEVAETHIAPLTADDFD